MEFYKNKLMIINVEIAVFIYILNPISIDVLFQNTLYKQGD